ncbi:MAG: hypothetical protein WBQ68_12540 [Terriglobales bacterium]
MQRMLAAAMGVVVDLMEAVAGFTAVAAEASTAAGVKASVVVADLVAVAGEDIEEAALLAARALSEPEVTGAEVSEADRSPAVTEPAEVRTEDLVRRAV